MCCCCSDEVRSVCLSVCACVIEKKKKDCVTDRERERVCVDV